MDLTGSSHSFSADSALFSWFPSDRHDSPASVLVCVHLDGCSAGLRKAFSVALRGLSCPAAKQTHKVTSPGCLKGPLNSGDSSALRFPPLSSRRPSAIRPAGLSSSLSARRSSADSFSSLHQNSRLHVRLIASFLLKTESFLLLHTGVSSTCDHL